MPGDYKQLGVALARLRSGRSLREAAVAAGLSRSALQRYEVGRRLPLSAAWRLDSAYASDGWIAAAVAALERPTYRWARERPVEYFPTRWPAGYAGVVWIAIAPAPKNVGATHRVMLRWGPWQRAVPGVALGPTGAVLTTGKAEDDVSVTCHLRARPAVTALAGIGDPGAHSLVIALDDGWERIR